MMSEASFASLGPTLLARKGGAKPAMRPQLTPLPDNLSEMAALAEEQLEDLGWNDMGQDEMAPDEIGPNSEPGNLRHSTPLLSSRPLSDRKESADIVALEPRTTRPDAANEDTPEEYAIAKDKWPAESPVVVKVQKRLEQSLMEQATAPKASRVRTPATPSGTRSARRAAFTLRLDTDRHLKLRLAATMQGVSAQSLVTEALDAMLDNIAELNTLVERMKRT